MRDNVGCRLLLLPVGPSVRAGVEIDIHQLRHAHAIDLINARVSVDVDGVPALGRPLTVANQCWTGPSGA
ncbi:hypothetical protein GCM10022255_064690 [Dactylosporangium darangshiense]|uniref:Uncharacterized protein n=1 Tax=Dactylosporangium darangshiense TaxID=579108 RepID=A0ABP8DGY6_9ACTN